VEEIKEGVKKDEISVSTKQDKALKLAFDSAIVKSMGAEEQRGYLHMLCSLSLHSLIKMEGVGRASELVGMTMRANGLVEGVGILHGNQNRKGP